MWDKTQEVAFYSPPLYRSLSRVPPRTKMAKEQKQAKKPKPEIKIPVEKKKVYFPRAQLLFSLVLIAAAVVDFFGFYVIGKRVVDVLLLLAGLWMLKVGVEKGFYRKRKEIFKRHL